MGCVLSAREDTPSPVEAEKREVISGKGGQGGPCGATDIWAVVLELGRTRTGGQWEEVGEVLKEKAFQA